jgi:hypothetical protein
MRQCASVLPPLPTHPPTPPTHLAGSVAIVLGDSLVLEENVGCRRADEVQPCTCRQYMRGQCRQAVRSGGKQVARNAALLHWG